MPKGTESRIARRREPGARSARHWARSNVGAAIVLILMVAIEAFGLRNGTLGLIAIGGFAGLAVTLVVIRFNMVNLAVYTTYAAAFTLTWNGWFVGPARPADVLALMAILFFAFAHTGGHLPRLPKWIWQIVIVVIVVLALNLVFRVDPLYAANRVVLTQKGVATSLSAKPFVSTNFSIAFKFIVATALVPLAFAFAATYSRAMARRLIVLFAVGAAISGWVAILGLYGITTLNKLTGLIAPGAPRQIGMAYQPNYLAAGVVLSVPIGIWLLVERDKWSRWLGLFITLGCVLGAYASGSRGGAVCVVGAVAVSIALIPNARKFAAPSFFVAITAANAIILLLPSVGAKILKVTRLVGASNVTDSSNQARGIAAHQAWLDFVHSPIQGIGYQVSFDAQTVYLQELQAGGLLLLVGMLVYNFGAIVTAYRMIPVQPLAAALCASVIGSLALDIFEADITDRFYYVPIAAIVALRYALPAPEPEPAEPAAPESRPRELSPVPRHLLGAAR